MSQYHIYQIEIDEFEGEESYKNTIANAGYYIYNPKSALPLLESKDIAS